MAADVPVPAQDEVLIEHPEIPGAVLRLPANQFQEGVHKPWPDGQAPWVDGAGNPIGEPPASPSPKPAKARAGLRTRPSDAPPVDSGAE